MRLERILWGVALMLAVAAPVFALPGVVVEGQPPGADYLPMSISTTRAQWFGLGSGFTVNGNLIEVTGAFSPMTTLGDTVYGGPSPAGVAARLPGNTSTTKEYLSQTGTGSSSAAPVWSQPAFSELSGQIATSQIPNTAVTPGSYTSTNLTVDAQGRITAASNGGGLTGTTTGTAFVMGAVTASQVLYYPTPIAITFPATFSSSNTFVSCTTNPAESDAYTLKSGGTSLATITVSTSCALTFSTLTSSHAAAAGEKLEMDAPATVSGNVSFSVQVTRS